MHLPVSLAHLPIGRARVLEGLAHLSVALVPEHARNAPLRGELGHLSTSDGHLSTPHAHLSTKKMHVHASPGLYWNITATSPPFEGQLSMTSGTPTVSGSSDPPVNDRSTNAGVAALMNTSVKAMKVVL